MYKDFEYIKSIEDFNEVIDDDWTIFHYICNNNYSKLEVLEYCLENGADLNIKDKYGNIPFYLICCNANKQVLEYCLENGADLNIKNDNGNTSFNFICRFNKDLISICKPYMDEYDFIKSLKEYEIDWKEYV